MSFQVKRKTQTEREAFLPAMGLLDHLSHTGWLSPHAWKTEPLGVDG